MREIWKWTLDKDHKTISMPQGARSLAVQMQGHSPHLWMLVDPTAPTELRTWSIVGTGHAFDLGEAGEYVGTFQDAWFVGHVFLTPTASGEA